MLINQTLDKLEALGLFGMLLGLREQLESSQYLSLSFDERLGLLVDREVEARDSRRLALRLKAAKLRQEASVEDIDFRTPRELDRSVLMRLGPRRHPPRAHGALPPYTAAVDRPGAQPRRWALCAPSGAPGQDRRPGARRLSVDIAERHRSQGSARGHRRSQPGALDAGDQPTAGGGLASGADRR